MKHLLAYAFACAFFSWASSGHAQQQVINKTAEAGVKTSVGGFLSYDTTTCYADELAKITVVTPPKYGTFEQELKPARLPPEAGRCVGSSIPGYTFYYTSKRNFLGEDRFVIQIQHNNTSNGAGRPQIFTHNYIMKVE